MRLRRVEWRGGWRVYEIGEMGLKDRGMESVRGIEKRWRGEKMKYARKERQIER